MGKRPILAALILAVAAAGADFRTKPETRGRVTTWLEVTIAKSEEPGLAAVTIVVRVAGPKGLEVKTPEITDAVSGWTIDIVKGVIATQNSDDSVSWSGTCTLKQSKPGRLPLPAIKVTFRAGPEAAWETVEWSDLLRTVRGLPEPVEIPERPSPFARWRSWTVLVLLTIDVLLLTRLVWMLWPRRRLSPLTPEQRATRKLDAATTLMATDVPAAHEQLADAVRGFLAERHHLQSRQQTTAEFLESLGRETPTDELRVFFERCDLVKFAGVRPTADECRRTLEMARGLLLFRRGSAASPPTPSPTRRGG